ncbi:uncharacterized protein F5891DRAFT_974138 [Suillus fuscotomentosus]|uniref:Uncharacterized protein n=1 Tax=Suillus fuscotomentosus TaxID=1912939 RepID=A0AAD4HWP0_9AGAM|nr:uncharacterized protein F5891DRAFT_974138 [Suillus fuscotomentosus]KAG1908834.1 hypothetical protein F5891DRAFT_974138 [Suillus fuscotomentosus]
MQNISADMIPICASDRFRPASDSEIAARKVNHDSRASHDPAYEQWIQAALQGVTNKIYKTIKEAALAPNGLLGFACDRSRGWALGVGLEHWVFNFELPYCFVTKHDFIIEAGLSFARWKASE